MLSIVDLKIAVIGLGYVGLPLAVEFGKKVPVVGFAIYQKRNQKLLADQDSIFKMSIKKIKQVFPHFSSWA
ncbi:hypothetical protein E2K73_05760 [Acinetobacter sp. RF15A]|nr:hypothetical protein E2K73_05760 [Acinetobacter sp. RF15A]TSI18408.1 hypothetical protein E2K74_07435 [Acinetobacter sp. RF15B]